MGKVGLALVLCLALSGCQTSSVDYSSGLWSPRLSGTDEPRAFSGTPDCYVLPIKWDAQAKDWRPDYRRIRQAQRNCHEGTTYDIPESD